MGEKEGDIGKIVTYFPILGHFLTFALVFFSTEQQGQGTLIRVAHSSDPNFHISMRTNVESSPAQSALD